MLSVSQMFLARPLKKRVNGEPFKVLVVTNINPETEHCS